MVWSMNARIIPAVVGMLLLTSGCGTQVPADPHGTSDRIQDGVLRVGVTANDPWVNLTDPRSPSGTEPALIEAFAEHLGAQLEWTDGSEAELVQALDRGDLDVVVGGFLADTPWAEEAAITRPYAEVTTAESTDEHVMIVRMGENGLLVELETFLHQETGQ